MDTDDVPGILTAMPRRQTAALVHDLSPAERAALADLLPTEGTTVGPFTPLDIQRPPPGDWFAWILQGGRGSGKTEGAARWYDRKMRDNPGWRGFVGAPTKPDGRATCVEGESGLLQVNPQIDFNRSNYELRWSNGSSAQVLGAYTPEDRERWRGPQWHIGWLDELGSFRQLDQELDPEDPDVLGQVELTLRLGPDPRMVVSMTPRRRRRIVDLLDRDDVVVTRGSLHDNPHTSDRFRERILERWGGTRRAGQEIHGELPEQIEGAFTTQDVLDRRRVVATEVPDLARVVVGVDPPGETAEAGIVAAGRSLQRWPHPVTGRPVPHGYVLADRSQSGRPEEWGAAAVKLYRQVEADAIVAEVNHGGDMVRSTIHTVDDSVKVIKVRASRGKWVRAEPHAAQYAQGLWHHVGEMPRLEDQLVTWRPERQTWSPDRLDGLVWAAAELDVTGQGRGGSATVPTGSKTGTGQRTLAQTRATITRG